MSKKKKVVSGKSVKKKTDKKPVKKAPKPSVKKNAAKNPNKPVKKADKKIVKKSIPKKASKSLKPKVSKKTVVKNPVKSIPKTKQKAKVDLKKAAKKVPLKKVEIVKKTIVKPELNSSTKAAAKFPVPAAKTIVPAVEKPKKTEEPPSPKKALADKKQSEVLAITNTIPVARKNEISASKIASISHSITNPIKKTDSYAIRPEKEPNGKFELEFVVHSSAEMLYEFLSTASGLSEWFCDDLNIRNGIYTFIWEDTLQQARLLKTVELQLVRFQWVDKTDGSYFEFRIQRDDLTNDISLIITDFAETASERESSKLLWHSQIEKLMHVIGSIF